MKKTISNIRTLAALLMAGAAFAACSSDDDIVNEQPANTDKQGYTLTISASKDGSATRALGLDGSAVVASWETTDEIVVTKNGTQIGTLSPTNIVGLEATFTGTISGDADINVSDELTLSYHPIASIEGFASQDGTLNGLATSAENFDMAIATVTISEISGKNIIVSEPSANFVNQTAVVVLSPHASYQSPGGTTNISSLTVSVTMDIPEVGTVTEKIGPFTGLGGQPYYFSLPSQSLLAEVLAAKYSLSASAVSTLLASATITFTGQQEGVYYLTCSKTGYKFAAGKYYKLNENNFVMTEVIKKSAADKDVYYENEDGSWSHTVTFAVNREIGWKVVGDNVFCGDKQLYVVDNSGPEPSEGWVKASDDFIPMPFAATYSLREPEPVATIVTWNSSNVSDLQFWGGAPDGWDSYTKEGVTLRGNAEGCDAEWANWGGGQEGIMFAMNQPYTGGYTFTAPDGKKFTKIEITATTYEGWYTYAYFSQLESGWPSGEEAANNFNSTLKFTWTGDAASVNLATTLDSFGPSLVSSIEFTLE
ncbi:MAG: hypothetical protein IKR31_07085 [Prevotella sp.]|nr:hypothetical protein [Prevotella sp.]